MLTTTVVRHRRHVRRGRSPSDNRPALGLDLQGGISIVLFPVEGTDTSGARHRGRHHPPARRRPRHRRARGAAAGQHDRRRPARRRRSARRPRSRSARPRSCGSDSSRARCRGTTPVPTTTTDGPRCHDDDARATTTARHDAPRRRPATRPRRRSRAAARAPRAIPTAPIAATVRSQDATARRTRRRHTTARAADDRRSPPATVATPQPGQTCSDLVATRDAEHRRKREVWLPGRPVDGGRSGRRATCSVPRC